MTALTQDRDTPERDGKSFEFPVAATAQIHAGALVVLNGGYAEPATTATGLVGAGRADEAVDNSGGSDGDVRVKVRKGVFRFANDAVDTIDRTHIGASAYAVDDQTVAATDGTSTRSAVGTIVDVDDLGVWIQL